MAFSPQAFRQHFPTLTRTANGQPLVYFDNAASTLKHHKVIARINDYNSYEAANVHRGAHYLSNQGTENYEAAREQLRSFIGARDAREIIWTRGTTESINLVAHSYCGAMLQPGDEIVITPFEHHSNLVPWQQVCKEKNLKLTVMDFSPTEGVTAQAIDKAIGTHTKFVACLWYSNSFGHRLPIEAIIARAHQVGAKVLVDGAQAPVHEQIAVQDLDCDFLAFSGHKMFGPYGIGILYGKRELLAQMVPYQTGGSMIDRVTFAQTTFAEIPQKFEAGTPNVCGAIGMGVAANIISSLGVDCWHRHLLAMREQILQFLRAQPRVTVYNFPSEHHAAVVSFAFAGAHPADVGTILDQAGIAVRAGHHCTQPTMDLLGIPGTVRASLAPYNTVDEVEFFCEKVKQLQEFF